MHSKSDAAVCSRKIRIEDEEINQDIQTKKTEIKKNEKTQDKINLIKEIQEYYVKGISQRKLATMYHMSRHTISKYIEGDPVKLACTERRSTINFDSLRNEILELLKQYPVKKAYSEAVKLGYNGKLTQFYMKCKKLFIEYDLPRLKKSSNGKNQVVPKITHHYVKRTDIFQYVWKDEDNINEHDLKQVEDKYPIVKELNKTILEFRKIFNDKSIIQLCFFLKQNKDSSCSQIRNFVKNLIKDIKPVANAVCTEYSNGFVEGTNNKLKMIKRQSYGRCRIKLLKAKIILQSF